MEKVKYKRILLKLSGEALAGDKKFGFDYNTASNISRSIKECLELGSQIAIVVGGGNFWRGRSNNAMNRTRADHIGMLGTTMNALAVADVLEDIGVDVRVQTAISMQAVAEPYVRNRAVRHMEKGRVVIFGCGTGNPFFSTDTAASLRAAEIEADIMMKATIVDGIYDKDPNKHVDAVKYDSITYNEILTKNLKVMDLTAVSMCKDLNIKVMVFNLENPQNIVNAVKGENVGTVIYS